MHIHIKHLYTLDVTSKQLSKNSNGDRAEYELIQLLYLLMLPINRKKKDSDLYFISFNFNFSHST